MNIGIVGTSSIAQTMIAEFRNTGSFTCGAVCSRSEERGERTAKQHSIKKVYTRYDDMLQDAELDTIYIATPNSLHYEQARAALLAGKHVICEKPFVPTLEQADHLYRIAKERRLFLLEAITTAYHPNYLQTRAHLAQIGDIGMVSCVFCQRSSRYPALLEGKVSPVFSPAYCGGALMDINLYNLHFVVGLFGEPTAVHYHAHTHQNGIDTSGVLVLAYPGFLCQCTGSKACAAENSVQIIGSAGRIKITPGSSNCQDLAITGDCGELHNREEGSPWRYEVLGLEKIMASKDYAACDAAFAVTRTVVKVLEAARKDAGLCF